MTERERARGDGPPVPDGPRVGLATYDPRDPEATFRPIEPFRPPREPSRARALLPPLLVLAAWLGSLAALAFAGLVFTNVGADDPLTYVVWSALFALANVGGHLAGSLGRRVRRGLAAAALLVVANAILVWLMTRFAPPSHAPDVAAVARAGVVMWLAGLPLGALAWRLRG
jgi:hypothetical protein